MFLDKTICIEIEKKTIFCEKAMKQKWSDIAFSTTNYRDTNIKILGSVESIESILGKISNYYIMHVLSIYQIKDVFGPHRFGDIMGFFK